MARKRASLKDKGAETLGLTQKKGKGIDVLFGGPAEPSAETPAAAQPQPEAAAISAASTPVEASNDINDLSSLLENPVDETPAAVPPPAPTIPAMPDSLPVNEADDDAADVITSETMADDLDLPMAMDGPPPDLELATPMAEEIPAPLPEMPAAAETPPAISLDSLPAAEPMAVSPPPESLPPAAEPVPVPPEDLAPAVEPAPMPSPESLAPAVEPAPIPSPESLAPAIEPAPVPPVTPAMPANEADDDEDDLSGLDEVAAMEIEDDLAGLPDDAAAPTTLPPSNLPPGAPPADAAPTAIPTPAEPVEPYSPPAASPAPTPYQPASYQPATPRPITSARPTQPTMGTPPSTATGARSLSMPRAKIESVGGIISEPMEVKEEDILPETTKLGEAEDNIIDLKEQEDVDYDEEMTRKVTRYVGTERRRKLDEEIERLYDEVAQELSVNKEDSEFALKVLSQAQDIVFEDTRQYDEAFYLVSVVKTMIARKRNLRRWTYTWGSFVFIYAIVWLGTFIAGYVLYDQIGLQIGNTSDSVDAVRAAWFAALAGGIGGVIGVLYSLYWHVAMKQDFDRQYVMYYMVQPVMGFILGAVVYFIIGSGFLVINFALPNSSEAGEVLSTPAIIAIQIVLGWAAGFRQRFVFEMVDKIVQRVSPKEDNENTKKPESLVPEEERQRIQARIEEKSMALPSTAPANEKDVVSIPAET